MPSMILDQYYPFQAFALPDSYVSMLPECDAHSLYYLHDDIYIDAAHALNKLVTTHRLTDYSLIELLTAEGINLPADQLAWLKAAAGAVYNHQLYFDGLVCSKGTPPVIRVTEAITAAYGSTENFRRMIASAANGIIGSGWVWLVFEGDRGLHIVTTENNETVDLTKVTPILNLDMWEHAYIHQKPGKNAHVDNWFSLINWSAAETRYMAATGQTETGAAGKAAAPPSTSAPAASSGAAAT